MTVAELIERLQRFPQDAPVGFPTVWQDGNLEFTEPKPEFIWRPQGKLVDEPGQPYVLLG